MIGKIKNAHFLTISLKSANAKIENPKPSMIARTANKKRISLFFISPYLRFHWNHKVYIVYSSYNYAGFSMTGEEITTIRIKKSTHSKLVEIGEYGDSMDDIINRLLESYKKGRPKKKVES